METQDAQGSEPASATPDYEWLSPRTRAVVEHSISERIAFIRQEHFIAYPQMTRALTAMNYIYTNPPRRRMECLYIGGVSGTGKTMLAKRFLLNNGIEVESDELRVSSHNGKAKIVAIDLSGIDSAADFMSQIGDACTAGGDSRVHFDSKGVNRIIEARGSRTLLIDEADRIAELPSAERAQVVAKIKHLTNNLRLGIIALGARKLADVLNLEDTLRHRFVQDIILTPLQEMSELRGFIVNFSKRLPLRKPPEIDNGKAMKLLMEHSQGGRQWKVAALAKAAGIHAILSRSECFDAKAVAAAIAEPFAHSGGGIEDD